MADPDQPPVYGGQAVVEGVMMRGAASWAVAVRQPDGDVWVERHPVSDLPARRPWLRRPLVRGVWTLADSLSVGTRALSIAVRRATVDEVYGEAVPDRSTRASLVTALAVFVGLFVVVPVVLVTLLDAVPAVDLGDVAFHVVESLVRVAVFLGYLWSLSLVADIRRVFAFHGAEHMTIAAWEHGETLTQAAVRRHSRIHVRCGTNFLLLVMLLVGVVVTAVGALVATPTGVAAGLGFHVALRVLLLPLVAGLAYEVLRLGALRGDAPVVRALVAPGLWLQHLTTREPDDGQVEVAIRSLAAVLPEDELRGRLGDGLPSTLVGPAAPAAPGADGG